MCPCVDGFHSHFILVCVLVSQPLTGLCVRFGVCTCVYAPLCMHLSLVYALPLMFAFFFQKPYIYIPVDLRFIVYNIPQTLKVGAAQLKVVAAHYPCTSCISERPAG